MRLLIPVPIIGDIANPNITYDLSVNFSTMPQPQHHDDHNHDGAGGCILNHYLHKPAMVIFVHNADDTLQWYRYMEEGCVYMFHKTLRMMASHGVYPLDGVSVTLTVCCTIYNPTINYNPNSSLHLIWAARDPSSPV